VDKVLQSHSGEKPSTGRRRQHGEKVLRPESAIKTTTKIQQGGGGTTGEKSCGWTLRLKTHEKIHRDEADSPGRTASRAGK
jgi:hypothetical protein